MPGMTVLERRAAKATTGPGNAESAAIREMVKSAKGRGSDITGPEGLLKLLTKTVLGTALEEEMTDHLGYDKHDPAAPVGQTFPPPGGPVHLRGVGEVHHPAGGAASTSRSARDRCQPLSRSWNVRPSQAGT